MEVLVSLDKSSDKLKNFKNLNNWEFFSQAYVFSPAKQKNILLNQIDL